MKMYLWMNSRSLLFAIYKILNIFRFTDCPLLERPPLDWCWWSQQHRHDEHVTKKHFDVSANLDNLSDQNIFDLYIGKWVSSFIIILVYVFAKVCITNSYTFSLKTPTWFTLRITCYWQVWGVINNLAWLLLLHHYSKALVENL